MDIRDDGISDSYSNDKYPDPEIDGVSHETDEAPKKKHRLDSLKLLGRLSTIRIWQEQEQERQAFNRYQMAMDEDYYDSLQYTEEDAAELMERGQAPTVYNEIKPTIDWMIGTERRTRIDYKVLPRRKDGSDDAEVKTKLMKYLSDVNKAPFSRSEAFAQAAKAGLGWLEVGVRGDQTDEPIFYRSQPWRYMLYDSNGVERDLSDSRYIFRWKYLDADIAEVIFDDRKDLIKGSVIDGNSNASFNDTEDDLWYMGARVTEPGQDYASASAGKYRPYDSSAFAFTRRDRVKLFECWYRMPVKQKKFRGGDFDGQVFDSRNPEHAEALKSSQSSIYDRIEMQIRVAIYCEKGLLWESESPFNHGKFPFIPVWAYRRSRDNAPYSPIRTMRDPQDSLNKRGSKALWLLSTNRTVMDEGAVDDVDEYREEVARPDAVIVKNTGKSLEINRDVQLAEEHLKLMDRDQSYIRNGGGVTSENLGRETNAIAGKAIIARQEQGGVITTEIFDNHRFAVQIAGEIELSLIEQFFSQEKTIRLTGERGNASFVEINTPDPETGEILNDVTATQADFKVSEQDYKSTLRVAMFESLFDIVGRLAQMSPETALKLLDLVVEMADVPNRDELVARIRQINGMRDPGAEMTEEEVQAEKQAKEEQAIAKEMTLQRAQAELAEIIAKKEKLGAEAVNKRLEALFASIQAGELIALNPAIAPVADQIANSAGFEDQTEEDPIVNQPEQAIEGQHQVNQDQITPEPISPFEGARQGIETPEVD
jgi:hypothetical protein